MDSMIRKITFISEFYKIFLTKRPKTAAANLTQDTRYPLQQKTPTNTMISPS